MYSMWAVLVECFEFNPSPIKKYIRFLLLSRGFFLPDVTLQQYTLNSSRRLDINETFTELALPCMFGSTQSFHS